MVVSTNLADCKSREADIFLKSFFSDVLVEALYLSVDPYMRKYMERYPVGVPMIGLQIAKYVLDAYYCSNS